ncbi:MAG: hypothetical protein WCB19_03205 [Thermoplasmata archaeon]
MAAAGGTDLLLFVAGEPGPGADSMRDVETSMVRRMAGSIVGGWWFGAKRGGSRSAGSSPPAHPDDQLWHLPPEQIGCANMVFDIAQRMGRTVALVDANRPAGHQDLVERWVGSDSLLPLLVRRDGARLEGVDEFIPRTVRRFIGGR